MEEMITRAWEQLFGRLDGPLVLRFVFQPMVASFLAIRAGMADARAHRSPYLWSVLSEAGDRPHLIQDGWRDIGKVFTIALVLDCAYQVIVFRWIHPLQALLVSITLAIVPYILLRGPSTRAARLMSTTS